MNRGRIASAVTLTLAGWCLIAPSAVAQVAVLGKKVHTMAGPPIEDGVILVRDGKIAMVGKADAVRIPDGFRVLRAEVVTPGLIDAHSTVGLSGIFNHPHDQDQLERSAPIQPELRAIDAYNAREKLVEWVRGFGVTTLHTGHAPGELISGQTAIVKTWGDTIEQAVIVETATVAATLSPLAQKSDKGKSPGTRGKMMAMLRGEFIKAQEYVKKRETAEPDKKPDRSLSLEVLVRVLNREIPLMVTAHRAQDIDSVLRLAHEFNIKLILDGASESYLLLNEIKAAGVPVIIHPTMTRAFGETENLSFETASRLRKAGIPVALQSGYESYVPKTRIVLFEAAIAAANGLTFDQALATITIDAAKILGIDARVGSLEPGKDGDLALYDGDPFEYTSHCTGVIINGQVVSESPQ
jgi:imidazolonepropionase-like amidohydrolase